MCPLPPCAQDTFDIRILMAKSVKYTVNFLDTKEEDLYRWVCVAACVCVCAISTVLNIFMCDATHTTRCEWDQPLQAVWKICLL